MRYPNTSMDQPRVIGNSKHTRIRDARLTGLKLKVKNRKPIIKLLRADITSLAVDAIVNAANSSLLGGGGVDGAIHDAAGPELLAACQTLGGCEVGDVKVTAGYRLRARYVFHAVGPVWYGGRRGEAENLASCYRRSMQIASERGLHSIAFPAISCGAFRYPLEQAAEIAVTAVTGMLAGSTVDLVIFAMVDADTMDAYRAALDRWRGIS